jgi:NOL1/NOP2/fmu family ribosome biogenesis protein
MFIERILREVDLSGPLKVLDLSAAPGGKTTHLQSLLAEGSLLVSNEVIRSRALLLRDQVIKWGTTNVVVTNNDPRDLGKLESYFDIILVDAPCSGSGLFRRDPEAIGEWSPSNVQLCSQRQQRILADVWPALRKDGLLIYSTCSYSREEDEDIAAWLEREFSTDVLSPGVDPSTGIFRSGGGYRFWPDRVKGEGLYMIAFRKKDGRDAARRSQKSRLQGLKNSEINILGDWVDPAGYHFITTENNVYAWPLSLVRDFTEVKSSLRVIYSGIRVGQLLRNKLVPDHALALSGKLPGKVPRLELDKFQAVSYLRKKDFHIGEINKGWYAVSYLGHELGWINALQNRINNYYPKQLRILKDPVV